MNPTANSPDSKSFTTEEWIIRTHKSHILNSKCTTPFVCKQIRSKYETKSLSNDNSVIGGESVTTAMKNTGTPHKSMTQLKQLKQDLYGQSQLCNFCKFDLILEMSHLPDMTYAGNLLQLIHKPSGFVLEFNVLDSLMPVIAKCIGLPQGMKVSSSEAWLRARMDCEYTKNVMNASFDWTFSTDYRGSIRTVDSQSSAGTGFVTSEVVDLDEEEAPLKSLIEANTSERININKLKQRNEILFYDEIDLFEDELADHGVAKCSAKIRVMSDSFFILLRFFLRVDNVFVRFYDTRLYHEFDKSYIVREFTNHECTISELNISEENAQALLINPVELYNHVPEKFLLVDKIHLPKDRIGN